MKTIKLGHSNLEASMIGLGCMGMSDFYGRGDLQESLATIHRALDLGVNFFDTADMYGVGHNEMLLGRALEGHRDEAIICTKFANSRDLVGNFLGVRGEPEYVKAACEMSLKRLNIDTIDLYYQHRVSKDTPIEETVGAMKELVEAGKVRYIGLSEADPDQIRRAHAVHPITALQTEYSLWTRHVEDEILPLCQELGITFVAYSPLGRGMLTMQYDTVEDFDENDWRRNNPRFSGEAFEKNKAAAQRIAEIAEHKGVTPAQLAIAWVHANDYDVVSIPGTKRRKYLEENVAAADISFSVEELNQLNAIAPQVVGTRY